MLRGTSLVLAVGVFAGSLAAGCGGSSCPEPKLEQCQDGTWLETNPCGKAAREAMRTNAEAACTRMLTEYSKQVTEGIEEEEVMLPPELGGGVGRAKVVPNPEAGLSDINMPLMLAGGAQQTAAGATADGLSAAEQALRDKWNANGKRVESCREYVYEKYYDYSLFEDAVAARYSAYPYIAEGVFGPSDDVKAIGTRGAAGETLHWKDSPGRLPIQAPHKEYIVDIGPDGDCYPDWSRIFIDNVFAAMPVKLLKPGEEEQYNLHDRRCSKHRLIAGDPWVPPDAKERWLWHKTLRDELLAKKYSPVQLDAIYANVKEFQKLMKQYREHTEPGNPACCSTEPAGDCCTQHAATGASLEKRLRELFDGAVADGCLEEGTTLCSWSPAFLVDGLRTIENFPGYMEEELGSFGAAMERDYQSCLARTKDDFTALSNYQFKLPDGTIWPSAQECSVDWYDTWLTCPVDDYTGNCSTIDLFLRRYELYERAVEAYWAKILASMPKEVFDPQGNLQLPQKSWSDHHEAGNSKFGVYYDFNLGWNLPEIEPTTEQTIPELCALGPKAFGSFEAGGWAFSSERIKAIAASFESGLLDSQVKGHLKVLDKQFWTPPAVTDASFFVLVNSGVSVSCGIVLPCPPESKEDRKQERKCPLQFPFSIAGWPMSLEAGIAGTLGMKPIREVTTSPYEPGKECWSFKAGFAPSLGLDAFGALNVLDAKVLKAGVRITLTLISLGLPVTWNISERSEVDSSTGVERLSLSVGSGADLEIELLAGSIAAFLSVGIHPFDITYSLDIFKWDGIKLPKFPLWYSGYSVTLSDLLQLLRRQ